MPILFGFNGVFRGKPPTEIYIILGRTIQKYLEETEIIAYNNKEGVDAQFMPPIEKLAFELQENEFDLSENLTEPLPVIVETLRKYKGYDDMIFHFPDIEIKA